MSAAAFPGSFDPFTLGHLDLVARAARLFDRVTVLVIHNPDKPGWLPPELRVAVVRAALSAMGLGAVEVVVREGLLVDAMRELGVNVAVRGLRNPADLPYEEAMSAVNRALWPAFEAVYLGSRPELLHVSSSRVRELWRLRAPLDALMPAAALSLLPSGPGGRDGEGKN